MSAHADADPPFTLVRVQVNAEIAVYSETALLLAAAGKAIDPLTTGVTTFDRLESIADDRWAALLELIEPDRLFDALPGVEMHFSDTSATSAEGAGGPPA